MKNNNKKMCYISARIEQETSDKLNAIAYKLDRPLSWLINKIIVQYLKDQEQNQERNK